MKRFRNLSWIMMILIVTALIAAPCWAEKAAPTKKTVISPNAKPIINPQIKPIGGIQAELPKPDLQVGVIKITPQNPGEGQEVTFEGNVMNYGIGAAANPVVILTITAPAGVTLPIFRKEYNLTLTKNQGVTFVRKFTPPKMGNYTCLFRLDPANMIIETNDNNNQKSVSFNASARPDLVVCIDNGKRPPVGGSRDISAVIKNIGHAASNHLAQMKLRFYVEGKGTKYYDIPSISPGQSHTITRNHKWGTSGTKTITAKVIYNWTDEISSQNNEVSGSYFVRLPHHDKYSSAPKVKCSTGQDFYDWQTCNSQIP